MPKRINLTAARSVSMVVLSLVMSFRPTAARAQVNVQVQVALPTIRFETAPALVEVTPGVQVVPDYEQEVFFVDGWYWYRSGPLWYQTRDYRGGWVVVQDRTVPPVLVHIPRGKYKHYKAKHGHHHDHDRRGPVAAPPRGGPPSQAREFRERRDKHDDHGRGRGHARGKHKDHGGNKHGHR